MDLTYAEVHKHFFSLYTSEPLLVRSPGRINLIGEHTDYNEGFVMPAAIDKEIVFAASASPDGSSRITALNPGETITIDVNNPARLERSHWSNYLLGVLRKLKDQGFALKPFNCVFGGNIPTGAGLSSSAALECGFTFTMDRMNDLQLRHDEMIHIAQWSEHHYAGVKCGIMDQFASMMGKRGEVFVLDCRTLSFEYFPLKLNGYSVVLLDTRVKHSLSNSEYNTRRKECEEGVEVLKKYFPEIKSLRDVELTWLEKYRQELPGRIFERCVYVVSENQRVLEAAKDLRNGNLKSFGQKMFRSHDGLSTLYEVSCDELDFLVKESKSYNGVLGSRMMGGGFGGCTINIVQTEALHDFISAMKTSYRKAFEIDLEPYVVAICNGTDLITITSSA